MANGFQLNRRGVGELLNSPQMEAAMRECAEVVRERAAESVNSDSGDFVDSLAVTSTRSGGVSGDRATARVESSDPGALAIEFGTTVRGQRTAQRPLRKGLGALDGIKP